MRLPLISNSKNTFISLWLILSICRIIALCFHYFRLDPFGNMIVTRVDRFLPFAIIVEIGAMALLVLPFLLLFHFLKGEKARIRTFRTCVIVCLLYFLYAMVDLEYFRYIRQHLSIPLLQTYFAPRNLTNQTALTILSADIPGVVIFLSTILVTYLLVFLTFFRKARSAQSSRWHVLFILIIAFGAGSSQHWLNPAKSRYYRLMPPLYTFSISVKDVIAPLIFDYNSPEMRQALVELIPRDTNRVYSEEYPLYSTPIYLHCQDFPDDTLCQQDRDGDGFVQSNDCDDLDSLVFPGQVEIPTDGIDQNCSGADSLPVNIVLVIGESFKGKLFNEMDSTQIPHMYSLKNKYGTWYSKAHGNGFPSVYGIASLFLGVWNHPTKSIFTNYTANNFKAWPQHLEGLYTRIHLKAADPYFDNQAHWMNQYFPTMIYHKGPKSAKADSMAITKGLRVLDTLSEDKPFVITLINHVSHAPFVSPKDYKPKWKAESLEEKYYKSIHYFDHHFGRLLNKLRSRSDYERTVFVIVGDHGFPIGEKEKRYPGRYAVERSRIPFLILSEHKNILDSFHVDTTLASQVDLPSTILGMAGMNPSHHYLGINLLKQKRTKKGSLFLMENVFSYHTNEKELFGEIGNNTVYSKDNYSFKEVPVEDGNRFSEKITNASKYLTYLFESNKIMPPEENITGKPQETLTVQR
jgi:hypothetical protein